MMGVEAALFELAVVEFGLRGEGEKAHEDLVITGFFALLEQGLGMIGVFEVAVTIVTAGVTRHELGLIIESETIGIGFQGEGLPG
jgi:hypothetical protein